MILSAPEPMKESGMSVPWLGVYVTPCTNRCSTGIWVDWKHLTGHIRIGKYHLFRVRVIR